MILKTRPRVLFYCQHLLGVGHLTRSLAICRELLNDFEVHFIQGGPDIGRTLRAADFHLHRLSPLMMDEVTAALYDPIGTLTADELLGRRRAELAAIAGETEYDAIITELFPFGRNKLKREILYLVDLVKSRNPQALIASSVRDILVEKDDGGERARKTAALVREIFDFVYVHSDPAVVTLDETYSETSSIRTQLVYTGFVSERPARATADTPAVRIPQVIVSQGGGVVGGELLLATADAARNFPELYFRFVPGPNAPQELRSGLEQAVREAQNGVRPANIRIDDFLADFEFELGRSRLSISLAGYNTMMNILSTRTPALVLPYMANQEQALRAGKLEQRGFLRVLRTEDLAPTQLTEMIHDCLDQPASEVAVDLCGASFTARHLLRAVESRHHLAGSENCS